MTELLSMIEVAERLGITDREAFDLIFSRQLRSVAAPSGRRLVPADVVDDWLEHHPANA